MYISLLFMECSLQNVIVGGGIIWPENDDWIYNSKGASSKSLSGSRIT